MASSSPRPRQQHVTTRCVVVLTVLLLLWSTHQVASQAPQRPPFQVLDRALSSTSNGTQQTGPVQGAPKGYVKPVDTSNVFDNPVFVSILCLLGGETWRRTLWVLPTANLTSPPIMLLRTLPSPTQPQNPAFVVAAYVCFRYGASMHYCARRGKIAAPVSIDNFRTTYPMQVKPPALLHSRVDTCLTTSKPVPPPPPPPPRYFQ